MTDYSELVEALRDEDNCNVLSYIDDAADAIEALQAELIRIYKQLPKRGEWEPVPDPEGRPYKYVCSNCHRFHVNEDEWYGYCPNCGAKMEVQE